MVRESKMREQNDIERKKAGDSVREQKQQKKQETSGHFTFKIAHNEQTSLIKLSVSQSPEL